MYTCFISILKHDNIIQCQQKNTKKGITKAKLEKNNDHIIKIPEKFFNKVLHDKNKQ